MGEVLITLGLFTVAFMLYAGYSELRQIRLVLEARAKRGPANRPRPPKKVQP